MTDAAPPTDIAEYLVDAQELHRAHPETFDVPDGAKLANPKPGDTIKIGDGEQRFWTRVVSADATHITATVDNATGREDRGYGADQLVKYERRHAYIHNTPKEQAVSTLRNLIAMGQMPQPTPKQQELRAMATYVAKRWPKHNDLFGQGASSIGQAMGMRADHDKILEHFRSYPKLLKAAGLEADNIGISHVQSHEEIADGLGQSVDSAMVDELYHMLHNLGVQPKIVCAAFND